MVQLGCNCNLVWNGVTQRYEPVNSKVPVHIVEWEELRRQRDLLNRTALLQRAGVVRQLHRLFSSTYDPVLGRWNEPESTLSPPKSTAEAAGAAAVSVQRNQGMFSPRVQQNESKEVLHNTLSP